MDIATKCQTHDLKTHYGPEHIEREIYNEKGFSIGAELLEEVVRCKDCVYWKYRTNHNGDEWGACLFIEELEDDEHWTKGTDFCSYGERSE